MPLTSHNVFQELPEQWNISVNPYVAQVRNAAQNGDLPVCYGPYLRESSGTWRSKLKLSSSAKLAVEIGCHNGQVLAALAESQPDQGFVGLDITFKRVIQTAQRLAKGNNKNGIAVLANAHALPTIFAAGEIDLAIIFYPDPWCKKAGTAKKRLVQPRFCQSLYEALSPGGRVWFKTDHLPYFEDGFAAMIASGFSQLSLAPSWVQDVPPSTFQRRFAEQGLPCHEAWFEKAVAVRQ